MARIFRGDVIAQLLSDHVKIDVQELTAKGIRPGLPVILVGEDSASEIYVSRRMKLAAAVGSSRDPG